jgi:protein-tyrosine phosphatase
MSPSSNIADFVWWVIPGKLLGVRKPDTEAEVSYLKSIGVGGIITLLDDVENHKLYEVTDTDFLWTPMKGGTAPDVEQVKEASEFISDINSKGKAVAIHCNNGRKRTGTMLAAQLVSQGMNGDQAISKIQELNQEAQLNDLQKDFLRNFKK